MTKTTQFDAADYLDTEARQVAYIAAARPKASHAPKRRRVA